MSATAHYETDFYLWTQQQAALLRQGEFNRLDLDCANIAEEIESPIPNGILLKFGLVISMAFLILALRQIPAQLHLLTRVKVQDVAKEVF